jgi:valyl-tRNA synthetase
MAAQGRDIKLSTSRVEGYRNFATKLWNAARFTDMNACGRVVGFDPTTVVETLNRWIGHQIARAVREVTAALEAFKFNEAANEVYRFVWNVFCDWYLELAKPVLAGPDGSAKDETRAMTAWALDVSLKLLHPFMPFVTEELWRVTAESGPSRPTLLALAEWPRHEGLDDEAAETEIGWVIDLVSNIRSIRAEINVPSGSQIPLILANPSPATRERARRWQDVIGRLARISALSFADKAPAGAVQLVVRGDIVALPLKGVVDLSAESARLEKELAKLVNDIARIEAKLANTEFLRRAPEDVVEGEREKRDEAQARCASIREALQRVKDAT